MNDQSAKHINELDLMRETSKALHNLLSTAKADILWDNRSDIFLTWQRASEISNIMKDLLSNETLKTLSPKARSMLRLLNYLGYVESLGVSLIDIGLILLIANGKEMHISRGPGIRHVSKLKELRRLDLSYKLHFLESNGLDYFAKLIDRNLRNDIAHLKFQIDDAGIVKESNGNVRDIDTTISVFLGRTFTILSMLDDIKLRSWLEKEYPQKGSE